MDSNPFCLAVCYRANIARQLGVKNVSFHRIIYEEILELKKVHFANSVIHLFLIKNLMCGLEKKSSQKIILEIAQWIASKHAASVRDKVAKEAEELYASGLCAAAFESLQKAIYFGDLPSRALMAWLLFDGREGVAKSWKKAYVLVEEGARQGCHHSKGVMALFNFHGYGIRGDAEHKLQRSMDFARESSERGSRYGQYTLGTLHRHGLGGLAQDHTQALAFYQLAAAQGFDGAQIELGYVYYFGLGVAKDYAEALRWSQLAAAKGHPRAMYRVASCHQYGEGVRKNKVEAIRWFRLAQAAGIPEAADALRVLLDSCIQYELDVLNTDTTH